MDSADRLTRGALAIDGWLAIHKLNHWSWKKLQKCVL